MNLQYLGQDDKQEIADAWDAALAKTSGYIRGKAREAGAELPPPYYQQPMRLVDYIAPVGLGIATFFTFFR